MIQYQTYSISTLKLQNPLTLNSTTLLNRSCDAVENYEDLLHHTPQKSSTKNQGIYYKVGMNYELGAVRR